MHFKDRLYSLIPHVTEELLKFFDKNLTTKQIQLFLLNHIYGNDIIRIINFIKLPQLPKDLSCCLE